MATLVNEYLDKTRPMKILEVGSLDLHNPKKDLIFRRYFRRPNWEFIGLDIEPGHNVDVVSVDKYNYPFPDNSFDLVLSGNTMEHVEDIYAFVKEIARLTKDLVFIMVPNTHGLHQYPLDCWRVFPDGMKFLLAEVAGLEVIECYMGGNIRKEDTIGVAKKVLLSN
jgi:SAM-dependent methyltransferase